MTGAIVIVSHNNLHLTKAAVSSALQQTVPCFVLVIDNGSTDGTLPWLRSRRHRALDEGQHLMVVRPFFPVSLGACWNLGIEAFIDAGIDKVLVLNNDVEIPPQSYERLAEYMNAYQEGLVTMTPVDQPESLDQTEYLSPAELHHLRVPHPNFSAFMIRRETLHAVGPFDECFYPAYCEDTSYHVRMHRAHIEAVRIPIPFFHARSSTISTASPEEREFIEHGAERNRAIFREMYGCLPGTPEYDQLFT